MNSQLFNLGSADVYKGLVTALFVAVIVAFGGIVQQPGFDLFSMDWGSMLHTMVNTAFVTFMAYLAKNLLSDQNGKVLGKIG